MNQTGATFFVMAIGAIAALYLVKTNEKKIQLENQLSVTSAENDGYISNTQVTEPEYSIFEL